MRATVHAPDGMTWSVWRPWLPIWLTGDARNDPAPAVGDPLVLHADAMADDLTGVRASGIARWVVVAIGGAIAIPALAVLRALRVLPWVVEAVGTAPHGEEVVLDWRVRGAGPSKEKFEQVVAALKAGKGPQPATPDDFELGADEQPWLRSERNAR